MMYLWMYLAGLFLTGFFVLKVEDGYPDEFEEWFVAMLAAVLWPVTWIVVTAASSVFLAKALKTKFQLWSIHKGRSTKCKAKEIRMLQGWMHQISKSRAIYYHDDLKEVVDEYTKLYKV
jgi:hypothetical protein